MSDRAAPVPPSRAELAQYLARTRIAGDVATTRENNLRNYGRLARRDPQHLFGLTFSGSWEPDEILALMAKRCGVNPDPSYTSGPDTIDAQRTIEAIEAMAQRLRTAADRAERVLLATGHPGGLLPIHLAVGCALASRGCTILTSPGAWSEMTQDKYGSVVQEVRFIDGVAMLSGAASLYHTHSPHPMEAILRQRSGGGESLPDLVVADHGWAGAAGEAGIDVVGFADSNDPALFVGEAEGKITVAVPLDDNVAPHLYQPLIAYLLARAGL